MDQDVGGVAFSDLGRTSFFNSSRVGIRRFRHRRAKAENSISIILSQLAALGVKKNSKRSAKAKA